MNMKNMLARFIIFSSLAIAAQADKNQQSPSSPCLTSQLLTPPCNRCGFSDMSCAHKKKKKESRRFVCTPEPADFSSEKWGQMRTTHLGPLPHDGLVHRSAVVQRGVLSGELRVLVLAEPRLWRSTNMPLGLACVLSSDLRDILRTTILRHSPTGCSWRLRHWFSWLQGVFSEYIMSEKKVKTRIIHNEQRAGLCVRWKFATQMQANIHRTREVVTSTIVWSSFLAHMLSDYIPLTG